MGCLSSKRVRCSRCHRTGNDNDLDLTNNICHRCIRIQREEKYILNLSYGQPALRDDNIPASVCVRFTALPVAPKRIQPTICPQHVTGVPRLPTGPALPRYTTSKSSRKTTTRGTKSKYCPTNIKPLFGEYKCSKCRNVWASRRSWRAMYQKCQKCGTLTYPYLQRELRNSDLTKNDNHRPHPEDLCEKCIRLGYYCGNFTKRTNNVIT